VRHQRFCLGLAEPLLHRLLNPCQTRAVLVLGEFADAAHAAIAQVVDVVDFAAAVAQLDEDLHDVQDVVIGQRHRAFGHIAPDARVELHAPDAGQVIGVGVVEQPMEESLDGVFRRRLAGAHHAVDGNARGELVGGFIGRQGLRDVAALVEFVRVQARDFLDARKAQFLQ
jgi:hypothetical protein